ncbi:MAG: hypothetical protein ACKVP2_13880 [Burkholderiales bacterium]
MRNSHSYKLAAGSGLGAVTTPEGRAVTDAGCVVAGTAVSGLGCKSVGASAAKSTGN